MRWSRTLIPTMRQVPGEAVVPSHQLMLRAGMIQQVASGSYTYLPLGWRVLRKATEIVRQEMDRAGAVEVFMPTLQPIELWEQTGRREAYGDNLFVVKDRHGREQALGPTHEEVVTDLVKRAVSSYRDLPLNVYQIQTKFRDEFRPRFGVLRSREFQMKDAYSFCLGLDELDEIYEGMRGAYRRIFGRCGLDFVEVEAEAGPIGGNASHEFMVLTPTGEDTILSSDKGNYAANVEKCEIGERAWSFDGEPTGELEEVATPGCSSIEDVCGFFKKELKTKLKRENMLKTLLYKVRGYDTAACAEDVLFIAVVVVRGDHEVNEGKLASLLSNDPKIQHTIGVNDFGAEMLDPEDFKRWDIPVGYVGPHISLRTDNPGYVTIVDADAANSGFWVTGANKGDFHTKHFSWDRDFIRPLALTTGSVDDTFADSNGITHLVIADIRNAEEGDPSPKGDGGVLKAWKGIEIGHVFKLGCKYSDALKLRVLDEKQEERSVIMGCYGIGVNRILAAAIESERGHDEAGIVWPMTIAPYEVVITPVKYEGRAKEEADRLYEALVERGVDVLMDDRDERPGVKFKDADLVGIPLRVTVGDKGLGMEPAMAEFKPRVEEKAEMVGLGEVVERVVGYVREAKGES